MMSTEGSAAISFEQALTLWQATVNELKLQMTRATFNTWLEDARLEGYKDGVFRVGVRNDYAKDWLENRLVDTVVRTLSAVCGFDARVVFFVREVGDSFHSSGRSDVAETAVPLFPGFEPYQSNFVQTPRQYFEVVIPEGPPVLAAFVGGVVAQTVGVIVNFHTNERREWWEASYSEIGRVCGINSKASVGKAVRLSLEHGYVKRKAGQFDVMYRLRRFGEEKDS